MSLQLVVQNPFGSDMLVTEEELSDLCKMKNELKKKIEALSQTTFEIYGSHFFMWEFPAKYAKYERLASSSTDYDINGIRRQFYGPFKKLEQIAREIQRHRSNLDFMQKKINEIGNRNDADPLIAEMKKRFLKALKSVETFNLSLVPPRGTNVGVKRRSPALLINAERELGRVNEEDRALRQKTDTLENEASVEMTE